MISFEWDPNKDTQNRKKHGISFDEAATVFVDDNAILFDDPEHSYSEERFVVLGLSVKDRLCIVCHCYRDDDSVIRIISARKANSLEKKIYFNHMEVRDER